MLVFFSFIIHGMNKRLLVSHSIGPLHEWLRLCGLGMVSMLEEVMAFGGRQTNEKIPGVLGELLLSCTQIT